MTEEQIARLWSKVKKGTQDECWPWNGALDQDGYGTMSVDGRQRRAHRLALIAVEISIPYGFVVDHKCRNRSCVNPEHLRVVTNRQNLLENSVAAAALNSQKTHCIHGHALDEINVTRRSDGNRRCRVCDAARNRAWRQRKKGSVAEGHAPDLTEAGRHAIKDA